MSKKSLSASSISKSKLQRHKSSLSDKLSSQKSQKFQKSYQSSQGQQLPQQRVMQEAIQKASCLIQLLTRQNSQSKYMIEGLNQQMQKLKKQNTELSHLNVKLQKQLIQSQKLKEQNQNQSQSLLFQLEKIRLTIHEQFVEKQKFQEQRDKNKKLHEKIAVISVSNNQLKKQSQKLNAEYKSLQNQNQYLLGQLKKRNDKENRFEENIILKETQFNMKLSNIDRTKQAFARRTHELRQQNRDLCLQVQILRKQKYQLQMVYIQANETLDALTRKLDVHLFMQQKIHKIYQKIKLTPGNIITKSKPMRGYRTQASLIESQSLTLSQKLEQIQMIINYRFQHIENLFKQICDKVQKPSWKTNLRQMSQMQFIVQRLANYVNQLTGDGGKVGNSLVK